jgi:hypothetical protein
MQVPPGSAVTLFAAPNAVAVFLGWSGACAGTGDCTLQMDADKWVTATFGFAPTPTPTATPTATVGP